MSARSDADRLENEARAAEQYDELGSGHRDGLEEVLAALAEADVDEATRGRVLGVVRSLLRSRLASQRGWEADPAARSRTVPTPLVVIGLPRTGTTALHHLLSVDERFQWIPHWVADKPLRRPPRSAWEVHPQHQEAVAELAARHGANPKERAVHHVEADRPEECLNVMAQSFTTMMFTSSMPLPRYHEWFLRQDEADSYARYADNLRLIAGDDTRPWLLKNPSHTRAVEALVAAFPDCRIVMTYRDPVETVPSGASVIATSAGSGWNPETLGRHRLRVWADAARRAEASRSADPDRFLEVDYRRFVDQPLLVARDIYAHAGLELTDGVAAAQQEWVARNPQNRYGEHVYTPEQFGLTADEIRNAFGPYLERYALA